MAKVYPKRKGEFPYPDNSLKCSRYNPVIPFSFGVEEGKKSTAIAVGRKIREFRLWRIFLLAAPVSRLPSLCSQNANPHSRPLFSEEWSFGDFLREWVRVVRITKNEKSTAIAVLRSW